MQLKEWINKRIMRIGNSIKYSLLLLSIITVYSCNRYIDSSRAKRQVVLNVGNLDFYSDSNVLVYKSNVGVKRDMETDYPKPFKVRLPKGLKGYEFSNSEEFLFFYKKQQSIVIKINLEKDTGTENISYSPDEGELRNFIEHKLYPGSGNYNIKEIPIKTNRRQMFIKRGAVTILLYNIEAKNYNLFFECVNGFSFIEK